MDSLDLVLAALAAAAGAAAKGALGEAGKDAYHRLKSLVQSHLRRRPGAELVLTEFEQEPDATREQLRQELINTGVHEDKDVALVAQRLLGIVDPSHPTVARYAVTVSGGEIKGLVQAESPTVTMSFGAEASPRQSRKRKRP